MASVTLGTVLKQIHRLFDEGAVGALSDEQLLARFAASRDAASFEVLVGRHGPMVFGVCRAVLRDEHDAEDAFQATFLTLARKAGSLWARGSLAGWLYRVAYRIALQANAENEDRRRREREAIAMSVDESSQNGLWTEWLPILHEEINRLPERHRVPMVLCDLQELSYEQAARELRLPVSTLRGRLAQARVKLKRRLVQRGASRAGVSLAAVLAARSATAAVPRAWSHAAVLAAGGGLGTSLLSASALSLSAIALRAMLLTKVKMAAALILGIGAIVAGTGILASTDGARVAQNAPNAEGPGPNGGADVVPRETPKGAPSPAASKSDDVITIKGRILGSDDAPFDGAAIYWGAASSRRKPERRTRSGADGRFQFAVTKRDFHEIEGHDYGSTPHILAIAEGFGPDWAKLPEAGDDELILRLTKDVPIEGRVLDLEGRPVAGARVAVNRVATPKGGSLSAFVQSVIDGSEDGNGRLLDKHWDAHFPGQPAQLRTDSAGRFRLTGFGAERLVEMTISGATTERATFVVMTRVAKDIGGSGEKSLGSGSGRVHGARFDLLVRPGRAVTGIVRDNATGKPLGGMRVGYLGHGADEVTGADGRFTVSGFPKAKQYEVAAIPANGIPYFITCAIVPDAPGLAPIETEIRCVRGVPYRLRIVDRMTGRPVVGELTYHPLYPNSNTREVPGFAVVNGAGPLAPSHQEADGTYIGAVLPGPGALTFRTAGHPYRPACVDTRSFFGVEPAPDDGGFHDYGTRDTLFLAEGDGGQGAMPQAQFDGIVLTNPAKDSPPLSLELGLERDPKRELSVQGPDGQPLTGFVVEGIDPMMRESRLMRSSHVAVLGLNPLRTRRITIRHVEKRLAGALLVRGDEKEPYTVTLRPWGTVTGRLVNGKGKPRAKARMSDTDWQKKRDDPAWGSLPDGVVTDKNGRFRIEGLVPGLKYSVSLVDVEDGGDYGDVLRDVVLEPGETRDLGDVRSRPRSDTP